jgi:hypothetical protein
MDQWYKDYGSYVPAFGGNDDGSIEYLGEVWCSAEPDNEWNLKTKSQCKAKGLAHVKEHNSKPRPV